MVVFPVPPLPLNTTTSFIYKYLNSFPKLAEAGLPFYKDVNHGNTARIQPGNINIKWDSEQDRDILFSAVFLYPGITGPGTVKNNTARYIELSHRFDSKGQVVQPKGGWLRYQETEITAFHCLHYGTGRPRWDIYYDGAIIIGVFLYFSNNGWRHSLTDSKRTLNKSNAI